MTASFSTHHLEYLQRSALPPVEGQSFPLTWAPPAVRRLARITAVGRYDRDRHRENGPRPGANEPVSTLGQELLTGLHGTKVPLAFLVTGSPAGTGFHVGTWEPVSAPGRDATGDGISTAALEARQAVVTSVLGGLYARVEHQPVTVELSGLRHCGMAIGVPTLKKADLLDPATAMDRLVRALEGEDWAVLVLAQPVDDRTTRALRDTVVNELRAAKSEADGLKAPSPMADHYAQLLEGLAGSLFDGAVMGAWRTGVYLLGTSRSYPRLAATWTALYNGDESKPEPVRVINHVGSELAAGWALPEQPMPTGPGLFHHPFAYQTVLNSKQLSAYVHLPERETTGFSVLTVPGFDVVPHELADGGGRVELGTVVARGEPTRVSYAVTRRSLLRHTFVAGVTGAGKTNTVFSLLDQADRDGVPFLVLEPAKTEYRALLRHARIGERLQVFTAGREEVAPLRINPFEPLGETPVGVHLDLLRSLFTVSFGMWSPLPQLLEQALHRVYAARGWDVAGNRNRRLEAGGDPALAFPTMTDLLFEVERVIAVQGWDEKISGDMRASLVTRINGLRQGGKGRMLDTQRSLPPDVLFEQPTVLELEGMGDDDDKAFLMGLLLIRLAEHRRRPEDRNVDELRHLLVIEEAHRLLTNVGRKGGDEQADPRAKAVESFANLLSEIRAYGQGVIVADQVPVKLAPDVIKNTSLKIAHRVVDAEDRKVLAGAMAMDDARATSLSILGTGEAAVFAEGDDAPVLVKITRVKPEGTWPTDDEVQNARLARHPSVATDHTELFARHPGCDDTDGEACEAARAVLEDDPVVRRAIRRLALALVEADDAVIRLWPAVEQRARAKATVGDQRQVLGCLSRRAAAWYAERRGADLRWSYGDAAAFAEALTTVLVSLADGDLPPTAVHRYREVSLSLHRRSWDPLPACSRICAHSATCLYRRDVEELIAGHELAEPWARASADDAGGPPGASTAAWQVATIAAGALAGRDAPVEVVHRIGLCFGQHQLLSDAGAYPELAEDAIELLLGEADVWAAWAQAPSAEAEVSIR